MSWAMALPVAVPPKTSDAIPIAALQPEKLTDDEMAILNAMACDYTQEEMVAKFGTTRSVIKCLSASICHKLGVTCRREAVCSAVEWGIIELPAENTLWPVLLR